MSQTKDSRRANGSGRIYKANGVYYLQYRLDSKRKSITLKTQDGNKITKLREAEKAARKYLEPLHSIKEIETREEYLEQKADLRKLKAQTTITLESALELALQKNTGKIMSPEWVNRIRTYWNDFVTFIHGHYDISTLDEVEYFHVEAYWLNLCKNGRSTGKKGSLLSNKTLNHSLTICKSVFARLEKDLGHTSDDNPFNGIKPLPKQEIPREIFTEDELRLIFTDPPPLIKAMFTVGICTGLREGDVATLKWSEISNWHDDKLTVQDFLHEEIIRITRKTKTKVIIPIEAELAECLAEQAVKRITGSPYSEYVIPEAAEQYLTDPRYLSIEIIKYLSSLGIVTKIKRPGCQRRQSVKDFHSLRHCFCYYAGIKGVPLPVVQSIVGHISADMTKHYQDHADRKARLKGIAMMRGLVSGENPIGKNSVQDMMRKRLRELIDTASDSLIIQLNLTADKLLEQEKATIPIHLNS
ncbi:MAG: tyrosine-type recombinase/integrase [Victivallales bacterium]|nr:tyrosine-type recombinase/integrase [Victivallales bacterium]